MFPTLPNILGLTVVYHYDNDVTVGDSSTIEYSAQADLSTTTEITVPVNKTAMIKIVFIEGTSIESLQDISYSITLEKA